MLSVLRRRICRPGFAKLSKSQPLHMLQRFEYHKQLSHYSTLLQGSNPNNIKFNIQNRNGEKHSVSGEIQDTILDAVIDNDLEIESFGVCEGCTACSTCHVILSQETYDHLMKKCPPSYEEWDMLDLAYGLTPTSRLGCQVELCKEMQGTNIMLPPEATDARS